MRITLLCTTLGWGGTERYVVDLALGVHRAGVQTQVIVDEPPLDRRKILDDAGIETAVVGSKLLSSHAAYTNRLKELFRDSRPDVVHLNVWERRNWISAALASLKIQALCTEHNCQRPVRVRDVVGLNRIPFSWYRQIIQALRFPIPAISISNRSFRNLRRRTLGLVKSSLIYNGVPIPTGHCDFGFRAEKTALWVGSMIARKRPLLAIEAIKHAAAACPGISLVMIGDGPLLPEARVRAAAIRSARIEFLGNVSNVPQVMAKADAFLQTSADEGLSYGVQEAMSVGLPVLATDVGATAEAVIDGETGYLVHPSAKAEEIGSKLASLLSNRDAATRMGASGLRLCASLFSLDRMIEETLNTYSEITANGWHGASEFAARRS